MSRTATTEVCPASWRQPYWLETDDGQCVPLIISDPRADSSNAVVFKLDTKLKAKGHALKMELKPPLSAAFAVRRSTSNEHAGHPHIPQEILAPTYMAPVHNHTDVAAIMRNSYPELPSAYPRSPADSDRKQYCTYWIRHGECDYMQQGCRYKHEMPDLITLRSIGFRNVPEWHKEKMRMRNMQRPIRPHPDVLQSILSRTNDDSASESGSDDSDATLAEATHRLTLSPPAANVVVQNAPSSPAPSTIDLLSFDDDCEVDPRPAACFGAPANTPDTSTYALANSPTPSRQGRFIPAGESLPRMSTPPLQPGPSSSTFHEKEEPKAVVAKQVSTTPPRPAPVFKQYFKDVKPAKSQEALLPEKNEERQGKEAVDKATPALLTQISELQKKLAKLAAETKGASGSKSSVLPAAASRGKTPPAPASSPTREGGAMARDGSVARDSGRTVENGRRPMANGGQTMATGGGLMASKHADRRSPIQGHNQGQNQGKVCRRSRSRVRDVQKSSEAGSGEKRGRRLPSTRVRKVVLPKIVGEENKEVALGKK
ncbi:hypothetical protein FKW77_010611 [Venturia effusa]|uniref:C3H1-type domain-containing protein n=1 Tax=Venturia effusa TaxID=50376 RepID=A0A517KXY6_9PEZI|nr:hypothetical protein FKW77_010611 [Venturia effusa]